MKIKCVIFDLDGTIADTLPLCIAAFRNSIEPLLGKTLTDEEIIATFGPSEEGTIRALIPEHEQQGVKDYLQYYEALHDVISPGAFDGVAELLDMLRSRGVKLAMVTGKGIHSTRLSLEKFALTEYFEIVETGSPDGPNKVNGIRSVLSKFNVPKEDALYVGDAPSDIKYCKEIGIPIAAAAWAGTTNYEALIPLDPDYIFYTIDEFSKWLTGVLDNGTTE